MKRQFVEDLSEGMAVSDLFVVSRREVKSKRDGEAFLALTLSDRSGSIDAVMWDGVSSVIRDLCVGDVVEAMGSVGSYGDKPQVTLKGLRPVEDVDPGDFLPASSIDPAECVEEIRAAISMMKDRHLQELLRLFFDDGEFVKSFSLCPAAQWMHHPYVGGLAEHTRNVLRLCQGVCSHYEEVDGDLLTAGGILHDIGKMKELAFDTAIDYTDHGRLLGHLILGYDMVMRAAARVEGMPETTSKKLAHMMISHHGQREWGSVKVPMFPEALILHTLDNLDAKLYMMRHAAETAGEEAAWSDYVKMLEGQIYLK